MGIDMGAGLILISQRIYNVRFVPGRTAGVSKEPHVGQVRRRLPEDRHTEGRCSH